MPTRLHLEEITPAAQLFGLRLKKRRKALGLTQAQFIKESGITSGYLSLIERGRANPTLDMMVALSEAVGMEVWDMLRPCPEEVAGPNDPK